MGHLIKWEPVGGLIKGNVEKVLNVFFIFIKNAFHLNFLSPFYFFSFFLDSLNINYINRGVYASDGAFIFWIGYLYFP